MSGATTSTVLEGDLGQFFLSEVLQFLQLANVTGVLAIERAGERAEIAFDRGSPIGASTSRGSVRIGELLVHRGALSRGDLARLLDWQHTRPERLGVLAVSAGLVPRDQVTLAIQEVIQRIVYGLISWRDGRFRFVPGSAVSDDLAAGIQLDQLILEGLRQADEATAPR